MRELMVFLVYGGIGAIIGAALLPWRFHLMGGARSAWEYIALWAALWVVFPFFLLPSGLRAYLKAWDRYIYFAEKNTQLAAKFRAKREAADRELHD
ncbi:hypothetical protein D8I24_5682 [Cupriavidus necator H850]|uniref:hypothetical protein n=1 Tax=Cupriavidus necator TaxID=106590 RepID=UPI00129DF72B|nr:hypothetical protein [Cupriavidus necator]KAI3598736.1 hypothetical protein D8I24_5682 [Cupriavidus necator H850]